MSRVTQKQFIENAKERAKNIVIDLSRDAYLDKIGHDRLKDSYFMDGETSPQHRYAFVSAAFSSNPEHAQRLYDYSSNHWLGYSTPVLSFGRNKRGLPISCFEENTLITTDEGMKRICEVRVGDKVLSHDGTFNRVENTVVSESDDMYALIFLGETHYVTGNHLILTEEHGWVRVDELDSSVHCISKID